MKRHALALVLLASIAAAPSGARADPVLIAGAEVSTNALPLSVVKRLYLGQATFLEGVDVELAMPRDGSQTLDAFLRRLDLSPDEFHRRWIRQILSGRATPPRQLAPADALAYVRSHPRALVIVDDSLLPADARRVSIIDD